MTHRFLISQLLLWFLTSFVSGATNQAGLDFLKQKQSEPGVVARPSGLLYKEIRAGSGKSPTVDSPCECHYAGTLIDGTEFDSSYKRGSPMTFAPNQVIGGWKEALQLMKEGAKWELYIPSELGYGDSGVGNLIPAGAVLVFELELLKVKGDYQKEL
ncbi:hypothetical protein MPSEU_000274000 [Mayamaea pseudoterrestris]|nr:hypothetical protein MPSEU_000274000 [Mayamaea pseudoterrestris]